MAVEAPTPKARVRMATAVKPGDLQSARRLQRNSRRNIGIGDLRVRRLRTDCTYSGGRKRLRALSGFIFCGRELTIDHLWDLVSKNGRRTDGGRRSRRTERLRFGQDFRPLSRLQRRLDGGSDRAAAQCRKISRHRGELKQVDASGRERVANTSTWLSGRSSPRAAE